jgi:TolB-like protein/cytochrome c-type biogenesis protein CcmH/NrfG
MMHAIVHEPPIPLHTLVPTISPQWEQNIDRCLAKEPDQRFQTIQELREAFRRAAEPQKQADKSVAVLFFENLSGEKEDVYFRDGMTEDIITELSNIEELSVFPRSTMLAYRDKPVTTSLIVQHLNARYVLEGTLRRGGNRLRITAQLVETRTGRSIWAQRFDREMEDVFAIQDEIAQSIARTLRVMLTEKEKRAIEKKPTQDVQAYDYYLQGRQFFHQFRRKGFDYARQMFARAIVIDPNFARAYAGVADCCSLLYSFWEAKEPNIKEADAASRKALELDPELAEAHVARGLAVSLTRKFEEAEREFETAIRQDPNLYGAYYFYARTCLPQGKLEKAAELFEQACRVRPEDHQAPTLLGSVYVSLGRSTDAEVAYRRAVDAAEKHLALHPDDARALYLGSNSLCQLGEESRGLDWAQRALEMDPEEPLTQYNVACTYTLLGKFEDAIDCLERAARDGYWHKDWILHDSDLDPLRDHPRFQALLEEL